MSLEDEIQKAQKSRIDKAKESKRVKKKEFSDSLGDVRGNPEVVNALRTLEERIENIEEHLGI